MKELLSGLLLVVSMGVHADVLWDKAELGESSASLKSKYSDARAVQNPGNGRQPDGSTPLYEIDPVKIIGKEYSVSFYFLEDKLTKVWLSNKSSESKVACDAIFGGLAEALRSKYGRELKYNPSGRLGLISDASWMSGKTDILLQSISIGSESCRTIVVYSGRLALESEKL